jgi:hypothetical protein
VLTKETLDTVTDPVFVNSTKMASSLQELGSNLVPAMVMLYVCPPTQVLGVMDVMVGESVAHCALPTPVERSKKRRAKAGRRTVKSFLNFPDNLHMEAVLSGF